MMKVLDRAQPDDCLKTLHLTNGNMHHAIKLVKLKKLIKVHGVTGELYSGEFLTIELFMVP